MIIIERKRIGFGARYRRQDIGGFVSVQESLGKFGEIVTVH